MCHRYTDVLCFVWGLLVPTTASIISFGNFFASFGMMLNISAKLHKSERCVTFNIANGASGTRFFNASVKSHDASVVASAEDILGIFTLCGENQQCHQCAQILCLLQKFCNTNNVLTLVQYTATLTHG